MPSPELSTHQELHEALWDTLAPSLMTEGVLPALHALLSSAALLGMYRVEGSKDLRVYMHALLSYYIDRALK